MSVHVGDAKDNDREIGETNSNSSQVLHINIRGNSLSV